MLVLSVSNLSAWFCDAIGETEVRGDATEIFEDVLVLCTCVLCSSGYVSYVPVI